MTEMTPEQIEDAAQAATDNLVKLNRELVEQLLLLAGQTGDIAPLIQAVDVLRSAEDLYGIEASPQDNADLLKRLGDTLFRVGGRENNVLAVKQAVAAYRSTITIASMLGAERLRRDTRSAYQRAMSFLSAHDQDRRGAA